MAIFTANSLENAKKDFDKVSLEPQQVQIMNDLANIISPYLEIEVLPLKGFMLRGIRQWQAEAGIQIAELDGFEMEERIRQMQKIFDNFADVMEKSLQNRYDADKLKQALKTGFDAYTEKYAGR